MTPLQKEQLEEQLDNYQQAGEFHLGQAARFGLLDPRKLAIAKTNFEQSLLWLRDAVPKTKE